MKRVISFSLWGSDPKYTIGAIKNAALAKEIFPEWVCRFYVGKSVPLDIIDKLKKFDNVEIKEMDEEGDWTGMFWRFYPASEPNVLAMISRDTDSRLSYREKSAVDEWMQSDKGFHIMRDHNGHSAQILGGMWGVKSTILKDMKTFIDEYQKGNFWQVDQNFLSSKIYPIIENDCLVHDEFFSFNPHAKPFPMKRTGGYKENKNPYRFIGKSYGHDDVSDDNVVWKIDEA